MQDYPIGNISNHLKNCPINLFKSFRALTNVNLFNIVCDALYKFKVRNHFSNAIENLLKQSSKQFEEAQYSSTDKIFKLICELGCTTPLMRDILVFAAYNGICRHITTEDNAGMIGPEPESEVIDMVALNDKAMIHWIKEFCEILSPELLPQLIKEIEKIGFERS